VGGRIFQNREKKLPQYSASHERMSYQEWDVHPKERNKNRGAERLITDQEHHGYYTKDHYRTFQTITE
jgi:guanyl-specific ribonuclease Sa